MPPGDQLTQRFDVEWESTLIAASRPSPSGLVQIWSSTFEGWWPTYATEDLPTAVGSAPGRRVVEAMYPVLTGVECRDPADLAAFRALVDVSGGFGDLAWWDPTTDTRYWVQARLLRVDPRAGARLDEPTLVDIQWHVPLPLDIAEVSP